ncbi:MAG: chemotaxis protein CheW [Thermodesulfobacteriota bacterium]
MSDTSEDSPAPASEISLAEALAEAEREAAEPAPRFAAGSESAPSSDGAYGGESVIQFTLGEIRAAVPLVRAAEIGRHPRITPLPNLPGWLLGVGNVRGDIVSMVDLAAFLGMDRPRSGRRRRFIVVRDRDMRVGLVVDRILGIRTLEALGNSGDSREETWHRFVAEERVLPDGVLHLIDLNSLLSDPEMTAFRPE